jgi:hypothetical protein
MTTYFAVPTFLKTVDLDAGFWNRVMAEFTKLASLIRNSEVFEGEQKQAVPNSGREAVA